MSSMKRKRGMSIGVALLCAGAMIASGAMAGPTTDEVSISYVTDDLATPAGTEALYQHIRRAAKAVCHEPNIRELTEYRAYRACYDRAVAAAVAKIDSSALSALHRSHTHGSIG